MLLVEYCKKNLNALVERAFFLAVPSLEQEKKPPTTQSLSILLPAVILVFDVLLELYLFPSPTSELPCSAERP